MTLSVSKRVYERLFQTIRALQKESPREPVTQKQTYDRLKRAYDKPKLSSRHVRRTFRRLAEDRKIAKSGRGQYWLPEYLNKNTEYLKRELEKKFEFEREFWGTVNETMAKRIVELEQKLQWQEIYYEDILEQKEREQNSREETFTEKDREAIKRAKKRLEEKETST